MTGSLASRTLPGSKSSGWPSVATAVAALLLVPACGGGSAGSEGGGAAAAAADSDTAAHTHQADGEAHAHGEGGTHTHAVADTLAAGVSLGPGGAGEWSGSATLLSFGDSVRVLVTVEGMSAGSRHPVELVADGCDEPGPVLIDLTPLATGSSGAGSSQTAFAARMLEGHAHGGLRLLGRDGAAVACAPVHLSTSEHGHDE